MHLSSARLIALAVAVLPFATAEAHHPGAKAHAQHPAEAAPSKPYAGQQTRAIKSLSTEDVAALEAGHGWGFAKPAELNAFPGPAHILELSEKLALTDAQRAKIESIFATMQTAAIAGGKRFLAAERALDSAFADRTISPETLVELTRAAGQARADLRAVHLRAHLEATPVLNAAQRRKYEHLRGYDRGHAHGSHSGH